MKAELKIMRGTKDVMINAHIGKFMFRKIYHGENIFNLLLTLIAEQYSVN